MTRRRVLIVTLSAPGVRVVSGLERFTATLVTCLQGAGYGVRILSTEMVGLQDREKRLPGVGLLEQCRRIGRSATEIARSGSYCAIVANSPFGAYIRGGRCVNVEHWSFAGSAAAVELPQLRLERFLMRRLFLVRLQRLSSAGKVNVAVSRSLAADMRRHDATRIDAIIPNGIDTITFHNIGKREARRRLQIPEDQLVGLFVGRFIFGKGSDILVRIATRLEGRAAIIAATDRKIGHENVRSFVRFPLERMPQLYSAADFLIFPSRCEGFGYIPVEAMASELPIVASRQGIVNDIYADIPELRPFIVDSDKADDYIKAIERLLGLTEAERSSLGELEREHIIRHYSLEQFSRRYINLIESVIN